jgi:apolipoprotein N-acyltransferase
MLHAARPSRALALIAGACTVFAFAPFHVTLLTPISLALLFTLWLHARSPRDAGWTGFAYGLGMFGVGVSWVYVALENFGGMPAPVAVASTAGFVAYLALWPAVAGWVAVRFTPAASTSRLLAAAGAWVLGEWLRGFLFTGFPWLAVGYAELLPGGALPFAGFAPVGGVFLVSLAVTLSAAAIAAVIEALSNARWRPVAAWALAIVLIAGGGAALTRIEWTTPSGPPLAVSLVQGNVAQQDKFDPQFRTKNFDLYLDLAEKARGRLVVLPESAFPEFADEIPPGIFVRLARIAEARNGTLLLGLFTVEPPLSPGEGERIYNSVVSLGAAPPQLYRKHHLVPFGESIPLKPIFGWFINSVLAIPLADQAAGAAVQPPFVVAGERLAVNICYEDVFGAELIAPARQATMLVNMTNDAWYGYSIAARQHNQISAMRALETGRPMLRATNTGITSAIGPDGRVLAALPWFTRGILEIDIAGRNGETPYMRWGDMLALGLALLVLIAAVLAPRMTRGRHHDGPMLPA